MLNNKENNLLGSIISDFEVEAWVHIIISIFFIVITLIFGLSSILVKINVREKKIIGYLNTFKSGIGLSSALFLILPRAAENISDYFKEEGRKEKYGHIVSGLAWSFVSCFLAFTFSLIILKVLFDFNTGNGHQHHHHDADESEGGDKRKKSIAEIKNEEEKIIKQENEEDEQTFKNLVTPKGRFQTFLGYQKMTEALDSTEHLVVKKGTGMVRASIVINRSFSIDKKRSFNSKLFQEDDENCKQEELFVNPDNVHAEDIKENKINLLNESKDSLHNHEELSKKQVFSAYLALSFIAFQSFFIGIIIGSLSSFYELIAIFISIAIYKSIENLSLGLVLKKSNINTLSIVRLIFLQVIFVPFGIIISLLVDISLLNLGLMYGFTAGILIYQTASESIVEEFTFTKHRFTKYFIFLSGSILVATIECIIKI